MFIVADLVSLIYHHFCLKELSKFHFRMATVLSESRQHPALVQCSKVISFHKLVPVNFRLW